MSDLYPGNYCVERWWSDDRGVDQTLAACSDLYVARAAYTEAIKRYPDKLIYLRQRSFVLERHDPVMPRGGH